MKRRCALCLQEYRYHLVRKYMHSLQLCEHCIDVIQSLNDLD